MTLKDYGGNEMLSIVAGALKQEQISRGDYGISMNSAVTDWGWTPATLAYLMAPTPEVKVWAKAVLDEFSPMFVGDELHAACPWRERNFNDAVKEYGADIEIYHIAEVTFKAL